MKRKDYASSYGVIGLGRFGMALVECLSSAGKEVIAIDKEESRVREARRFTEMALVVENLDQEALEEAGIRNCDVVVVCIGERIDVSILVTMTVLKMGIAHVISKATSFIHGEALKQLGASVVFPERDMAIRLGKGLIYDSFLRYGVNIIAIEHDGHTNVNFNADYFFREGDAICIVGQSKNVEYFEKDIH